MSDNQKRILDLLAEKKISVDEAQRLLSLTEPDKDTGTRGPEESAGPRGKPKYFRVLVQPEEGSGKDNVNVRIPIALIRAGMKLTALIPVDQGNQPVAYLQADDVHRLHVVPAQLLLLRRRLRYWRRHIRLLRCLVASVDPPVRPAG